MKKTVFFHVDMDSLETIFEAHGKNAISNGDHFFLSAVDNSLSFFDQHSISATYFVVARDLEIACRRKAIKEIVSMGHRLASHSITHRLLRDLEYEQKKVEISDFKNKIEHVAGIEVSGFRSILLD